VSIAGFEYFDSLSQRFGSLLQRCELRLGRGEAGIDKHTDDGGIRHEIMQHAEPLWFQ
jgi:hypothetical protein